MALSGIGGDELFAGYSSFDSVPRMMKFQRYAGWLRPLGKGIHALLEGARQTGCPRLSRWRATTTMATSLTSCRAPSSCREPSAPSCFSFPSKRPPDGGLEPGRVGGKRS